MTTQQRSILLYTVAAVILLIPFLSMQFSKEVNWSGFDFVVAGILLFGTAFGIDLVLRKVNRNGKKMFYILLVLLALFLIWAELAVGIFGSPFAGS